MEIILSIVAGMAVMRFTSRFFFQDTADLIDTFKYWSQPAKNRFMWGHHDGEFFRQLRFFVWLILGYLSGYGVYRFLIS